MNHAVYYSEPEYKVVNLFSRKPVSDPENQHIVRITPELERICMLYAHPSEPDTFFSLPLIAWGRQKDGTVTGLYPWLNSIIATEADPSANAPRFQGYYDPTSEALFYDPPEHTAAALRSATHTEASHAERLPIQEIPDVTGTHVLTVAPDAKEFHLSEVDSWALFSDGSIEAMLADEQRITETPVLPGDDCLEPVSNYSGSYYYFQHRIANQIKQHNPEALDALQKLIRQSSCN